MIPKWFQEITYQNDKIITQLRSGLFQYCFDKATLTPGHHQSLCRHSCINQSNHLPVHRKSSCLGNTFDLFPILLEVQLQGIGFLHATNIFRSLYLAPVKKRSPITFYCKHQSCKMQTSKGLLVYKNSLPIYFFLLQFVKITKEITKNGWIAALMQCHKRLVTILMRFCKTGFGSLATNFLLVAVYGSFTYQNNGICNLFWFLLLAWDLYKRIIKFEWNQKD